MRLHHQLCMAIRRWPIVSVVTVLWLVSAAHANLEHYFIALDSLQTLTSGTYAGLPNPNYGRLTFLYAHLNDDNPSSNHFHGIGAYSYTGPVESPEVLPTNANNRIPEGFSEEPPLRLFPGTGGNAFKLISKVYDSEYSDLLTESIQALSGFPSDSPEGYLYNSSNGRWRAPLTEALVALELVEISHGLHIANDKGEEILKNIGDVHILGHGDTLHFTPVFWTHGKAAAGTDSAAFRLHDLRPDSEPFAVSGTFYLDFRVPEPIMGTEGHDYLVGTEDDDIIYGLDGDDIIMGKGGNDLIYAGSGHDIVFGGRGDDAIDGGEGDDKLFGGPDDDTIDGGPGRNIIVD
jgi:hypothetical protein